MLYYCQQKQLIFPWEFSKLLQHIFLETALLSCVLPFSHFYILTVMLRIGLCQKINLIDVNTTWIVYFKREQLTFACLFFIKTNGPRFYFILSKCPFTNVTSFDILFFKSRTNADGRFYSNIFFSRADVISICNSLLIVINPWIYRWRIV